MTLRAKVLRFLAASALGLLGGAGAAATVFKVSSALLGQGSKVLPVVLAVAAYFVGAILVAALVLLKGARRAKGKRDPRPLSIPGLVAQLLVYAVGLVVVLVGIGVAIVVRQVESDAPGIAGAPTELFPVASVPVPRFPELGAPRSLPSSSVVVYQVDLATANAGSQVPGSQMKMRVYLPPGHHPEHSLGCVLVAPAGTNLLTGNDLDEGDYHAETLPYAEAGYAVVFYSLDGGLPHDLDKTTMEELTKGYLEFRAAHAGVVNARNALELVLARLPEVDPKRIFAAGHSSAAVASLLFAEHEPRLEGVIAYAPAVDVEARFAGARRGALGLSLPGLGAFVKRSSPRTHMKDLGPQPFLFHAVDDSNCSVVDSAQFAEDLEALGKHPTFRQVAHGGHYQSMVREGIPAALAWLRTLPGESSPGATAKPDGAAAAIEHTAEGKPVVPWSLAPPPEPSGDLGELDPSKVDGDSLAGASRVLADRGELKKAIVLQHAAVKNTGRGRYNLACWYGRDGAADAALYWLVEAAKTEGMDTAWAAEDADLAVLHRDRRWPAAYAYLRGYADYWAKSGVHETVVVVPKNATRSRPIPALVGLHGLGANATSFVDADAYQGLADRLGVAFIGVSGTNPNGPTSYSWAEDPEKDARRVAAALAEASARVSIAPGKVILFGFSQGGAVAAELAARDPQHIAGAIVMSPGGLRPPALDAVKASPLLRQRGFVFVCGAGEHPGNVKRTADGAAWFSAAGAKVEHRAYEGVRAHAFPPDFLEALPRWVGMILDASAKSSGALAP
jgi:predicted esterase